MSDFAKNLLFDEDARVKLRSGIDTIAKAVASTLGPRGRTVLIEDPTHTHGITSTKDGVTVAKSIELLDPVENLAVRIMKQSAERTGSQAGDGTSSSVVLSKAIIDAGFEEIKPEHNRIEVLRELSVLTEEVVKTLKKKSKKVTGQMLLDVATISANNDPKTGKLIADAYEFVGEDGIVIASKSQTDETYSELTKGIRIKRGWSNRKYINDFRKEECVFENCKILVCDAEITNWDDLNRVISPFLKGEKLLLIAPCSKMMENSFIHNIRTAGLSLCNIMPPAIGWRQHDLMEDIAIAVGAKCFTEESGENLSLITPSHLGHAVKVVVGQDTTTVILDEDNNKDEIRLRVAQLKDALSNEQEKDKKEFILERIASLNGGIGVIYVGGKTDTEQKELYDRIDDSICATRSALEEGIVEGGGKALFDIVLKENRSTVEGDVAVRIMTKALKAPLIQILANAGLDYETIYADQLHVMVVDGKVYRASKTRGYNVKTKKYGNMIRLGVIDPTKVVRCSLENAISVATTILSTDCTNTIARQ